MFLQVKAYNELSMAVIKLDGTQKHAKHGNKEKVRGGVKKHLHCVQIMLGMRCRVGKDRCPKMWRATARVKMSY